MEFLPPEIDAYALAHTSPEPALLAALNRETWLKVLNPRMLSGHLQGRLLSLFSKLIRPTRILEIGTYTGYSALCLAEGLSENGQLDTIEANEELTLVSSAFFAKSAYAPKIVQHTGQAQELIPQIEGEFDMVFIDADKENYSRYYDLIIDRVRSGGIIIADNVLWSGKVVDTTGANDPETKALRAFNLKVQADQHRVENILFPVRDGLMIVRKR
ncbi:MAG: O-methyltransferase [Bacteroidia bacterium]|nr:O-methyltransferase [Bacteroidia bacterium]MCC6769505.1 O-methyltransferase [Bacteroidia bacterium]